MPAKQQHHLAPFGSQARPQRTVTALGGPCGTAAAPPGLLKVRCRTSHPPQFTRFAIRLFLLEKLAHGPRCETVLQRSAQSRGACTCRPPDEPARQLLQNLDASSALILPRRSSAGPATQDRFVQVVSPFGIRFSFQCSTASAVSITGLLAMRRISTRLSTASINSRA